ncbi:hypothetical protein [Cellulophaga sp. Asnod2-G02]|uniref:hypothetical protein n=1 Tax=Cellulophaga sp. Asnod2-G02 TaxID=3160572 RepID=UPI00386F57EF
MATDLLIKDGNTWWLSPDIWVVPSTDPNDPPGVPVAGTTNYVWGRIKNKGETSVENVRVNFYWSNPATGVLRSNSSLIGSAFVSLGANEEKEILCINAWRPTIVNDGHECLVAEAIHFSDPLPPPLPDAFNPPRYEQIAQRNLEVIELSEMMKFVMLPIQVSADNRSNKIVTIKIEEAKKIDDELMTYLVNYHQIPKHLKLKQQLTSLGLAKAEDAKKICENVKTYTELNLELSKDTACKIFLAMEKKEKTEEGFQLIHVTEHSDGKLLGGISFIVYSTNHKKTRL